MSQIVDVDADFIVDEDDRDIFETLSPRVVLYDHSTIADDLIDEISRLSWSYEIVNDGGEALAHVGKEEGDCLIVDPAVLDDPAGFVRDVRYQADVPVIVWGNDIKGDDVRQIAGIRNATYVPKPDASDERVFCLPSMDQPPQSGPMSGLSSPSSDDGRDEVVISLIYHAVRAYMMTEQIEIQIDAIEKSINGIGILDEEYDFLYVNEKLADLFDYGSTDVLVGNSVQMCFPRYEIGRLQDEVLDSAVVNEGWRGGVDCRRMDGSTFPARISLSTIGSGKYLFTIEDISEQEVLQQELDEFHEHIEQAFVAVGDDFRTTYVNHAARAYFDLPDGDQVIGEPFFEMVNKEFAAELRDNLLDVDSEGDGDGVAFSSYLDSYDSWIETRLYSFARGYAIYFRDVTEQKEQHRQLELAKNFIEKSTDAYYVVEVETGDIVDVNPTAHKWLGTGESELVGMNIVDLMDKYSDHDDYTIEDHHEFCERARGGSAVHKARFGPPAGEKSLVEAEVSHDTVNGEEYLVVASTDGESSERAEGRKFSSARSFIKNYPEAVLLLDPSNNEIVEANPRSVELTGYSRDDLIGAEFRTLFPDEVADVQIEKHEQVLDNGGGSYSTCGDGSYVRIETEDESISVEVSTSTIDVGGGTSHFVTLRPIEDTVQYKRSFKQVRELTQELSSGDRENDLAKTAVDAIGEIPIFDCSGLYLYDDEDGVLELAAHHAPSSDLFEGKARLHPGDGDLWGVYNDDQVRSYGPDECAFDSSSESRGMALPIGSHGVLLVCCSPCCAEDDIVETIANLVASSVESALDRARSIMELKHQERDASMKKQRLEDLSDLNEQIRSLNKALVQAESEDAIKEAVCEGLITLDDFDGVHFCDITAGGEQLDPAYSVDVADEFLDRLQAIEPRPQSPTVHAGLENEMSTVANIATEAKEKDWAAVALEYEYKSATAIPLEYGDITYGVLTIYSEMTESFDGRTNDVLEELGSLIAYAFQSVTTRAALGSESGIDLSLTIEQDGGVPDLAERLGTSVTVQNITPTNDDYYLIHGHVMDTDHDDVEEAVDNIQAFDGVRLIGEPKSGIYELKVAEPGSLIKIVNLGVPFQSAVATPDDTEITVTLPATRDRGEFIDQVKDILPSTELRATQGEIDSNTIPWTRILRDPLTKKQETALRTAYHVGYFDSPSKTNGRELAEVLGVSQGTISYRLRAAQRNLYETLWNNEPKQTIGNGN